MNLRFSKPMVKAIAAICIAVLTVTSACLAVFAAQNTTTQETVTVDDSAHTVDVSKNPCVSAGTFRELYPDFTVLDSRATALRQILTLKTDLSLPHGRGRFFAFGTCFRSLFLL